MERDPRTGTSIISELVRVGDRVGVEPMVRFTQDCAGENRAYRMVHPRLRQRWEQGGTCLRCNVNCHILQGLLLCLSVYSISSVD